MRPLRYSINVTLDGCCDHRAIVADEELHRHAVENFEQADALLFGRVTYEMVEAAWREPARTGVRPEWMSPWMEPFARTIDAAKKYVVSSTLDRVDWVASFSISLVLASVTPVLVGVAVLLGRQYPTWIGWVSRVGGIGVLITGEGPPGSSLG
jgi:hypothetical protein